MIIILISFFSGIVSGMGIGGGTILIPALTIFFSTKQQIAQSVNLLVFIPTGLVAVLSHLKQGNIEKGLTLKLILGGVAGAIGGSYLAVILPAHILRRLFGIFLFVMGVYEIFCKREDIKKK
jgi:uncharacterized protein